eukprot:TRINITY_DN11025_c0_g1_i1.p1 TRINITY_DN11025_c0_g1~~TRINITY_DN11025_c0_g1_i1.p1  ORF type:complete len:159 (-),score=40.67 TRINITY_DN11025_c0_g1_i1:277-693(-)
MKTCSLQLDILKLQEFCKSMKDFMNKVEDGQDIACVRLIGTKERIEAAEQKLNEEHTIYFGMIGKMNKGKSFILNNILLESWSNFYEKDIRSEASNSKKLNEMEKKYPLKFFPLYSSSQSESASVTLFPMEIKRNAKN